MAAEVRKAEWFAVMTLTAPLPHGGGVTTGTRYAVVTVNPDTTRAQIFEYMRGQFSPEFANGNVTFFSAAPNRVGEG